MVESSHLSFVLYVLLKIDERKRRERQDKTYSPIRSANLTKMYCIQDWRPE